jgi:hypothetical protein
VAWKWNIVFAEGGFATGMCEKLKLELDVDVLWGSGVPGLRLLGVFVPGLLGKRELLGESG